MSSVVGLAGFTGAGKTTAIQYLVARTGGLVVYLGDTVRREVLMRELPPGSESERRVRMELRAEDPAALARGAAGAIVRALDEGSIVYVDAVMSPSERDFLQDVSGGKLIVVAIVAPFAVRIQRLARRLERPATAREIRLRDQTEVESLSLDSVLREAEVAIQNDGTRRTFNDRLHSIKQMLRKGI